MSPECFLCGCQEDRMFWSGVRGLSQAFSPCHLQRQESSHPWLMVGIQSKLCELHVPFSPNPEWTESLFRSLSLSGFSRHTLDPCSVPSISLRHNLLHSGNLCSVLPTTLWFFFALGETFLTLEVLECLLLTPPSPLPPPFFYFLLQSYL